MNLQPPNVILVGTGVVGRAIFKAHFDAGVSVRLADQNRESLRAAVEQANLDPNRWQVSPIERLGGELPSQDVRRRNESDIAAGPKILIESIAEKLDVKRAFFRQAAGWLDEQTVFATNTSTLRIAQIAEGSSVAERICGMHFFMPVEGRPAVELVRGPATAEWVIEAGVRHIERIGKSSLLVADSPGFLVNRLLSPYLNEAMLLLCRGVSAEQIERAAIRYGMPMSPLELIDLIGTRTMFDAGRAFWQAFPARFDPAPVLGAMIKAGRSGRASGRGFYDYENGQRSTRLSPVAIELCKRYERNPIEISDDAVMLLLAVPMWIEAAFAFREDVVSSPDRFDLAMSGGLGYRSPRGWLQFFDSLGSQRLADFVGQHSTASKSLRVPDEILTKLRHGSPSDCLRAYGEH